MRSVIVLIGTPDPEDRPLTSAELIREYERETVDYFRCRQRHWALSWVEVFTLAMLFSNDDDSRLGNWDDEGGLYGT